jgi:hypothetical protein
MVTVTADKDAPPHLPQDFGACWEGQDQGLIAAWQRGLEKRHQAPELARQCEEGQLPLLAWKGGIEKVSQAKNPKRIGSLLYLATWQGLRGEDLCIDTQSEPVIVCRHTGVKVIFTLNTQKLAKEGQS